MPKQPEIPQFMYDDGGGNWIGQVTPITVSVKLFGSPATWIISAPDMLKPLLANHHYLGKWQFYFDDEGHIFMPSINKERNRDATHDDILCARYFVRGFIAALSQLNQ